MVKVLHWFFHISYFFGLVNNVVKLKLIKSEPYLSLFEMEIFPICPKETI